MSLAILKRIFYYYKYYSLFLFNFKKEKKNVTLFVYIYSIFIIVFTKKLNKRYKIPEKLSISDTFHHCLLSYYYRGINPYI